MEAREWGYLLVIAAGLFLSFLLLGVGLSSYTTFFKCGKTDTSAHFRHAAKWAVYPTLAYVLVRGVDRFRVYFERFYRGLDSSEGGKTRAGWISVGYVVMLAALAGMFALMDSSVEDVCVPTVDEATRFRQDMLKRQAEKEKARESTPAVQVQTQSGTTQ